MSDNYIYLIYVAPLLVVWYVYLRRGRVAEELARKSLAEARAAGLTEPASLHPVIDMARCIGCGSCVKACPEGNVLGVIDGKSQLVNPSHCIGHGACRAVCPVEAITLVFGTEKRGVDIPLVKPDFETNVPGIFIAGELGGMGLIRNAIEQGRQALESVSRLSGIGKGDGLDVVIVGAGPAGFAASLAAHERGLRYRTVEQDSFGGTVSHYPRGKIVMTAPVKLPMVGKVKFGETTKEALLSFWQDVAAKTRVSIQYQERLESVERKSGGFTVKTTRGEYHTRAVLLAIGRRGTPRTLGVPGEELAKVVYRLIDAEQYRGMHVLVVGGGDSALEAAATLAGQPGTTVTLSYRSEAFSRAKEKNRQSIDRETAAGRLRVLLSSNVIRIEPDQVHIDQNGETHVFANDAVIISAGGVLPTPFLKQIGIEVETKFGVA